MSNPHQAIVDIARSQLGVSETSRNRGPGLAKYWEATSYPTGMDNREPWCAAFVAWVIREAGRIEPRLIIGERTRPKSAAVRYWEAAARNAGWKVFSPGAEPIQPGDVVIYNFSHIGIAESATAAEVTAIEGNTDDNGSREGVKVARRKRPLRLVQRVLRVAAKG